MYGIDCETLAEADKVLRRLRRKLAASRFTANLSVEFKPRGRGKPGIYRVNLAEIRLLEKKHYCRNHGGPCRIGGVHRGQPKRRWLEGQDWRSFNDMVNDALDALKHGGSGGSGHCLIRRDGHRCVSYSYGDEGEWHMEGQYEDWRGKKGAPSSCEDDGTPGLKGWRKKRVRKPKVAGTIPALSGA